MNYMNILFTSAGRRVALVRLFRDAMADLGVAGTLHTADTRSDAAAHMAGDLGALSPPVTDDGYAEWLESYCKEQNIGLIVPLVDPELHILSARRERLADAGTVPLVSGMAVSELSFDKRKTADFFCSIGINTPHTYTEVELSSPENLPFPLILKPAHGSGSLGVQEILDTESLAFFISRTVAPVVQDLVIGSEYTIDVLANHLGEPVCVVPRRRISVRAGEVSKGETVKHRTIMDMSAEIVRRLPGAFGPITLQCIEDDSGQVFFIEINPRFGGGYPLAAAAGANFPRWIIEQVLGRCPRIGYDDWLENLFMLRYDDAFFLTRSELISP